MNNTATPTRDEAFTAECAADEEARADRRFAAWQRRQRQETVRVAVIVGPGAGFLSPFAMERLAERQDELRSRRQRRQR